MNTTGYSPQTELWLTLSQAFLPLMKPDVAEAFLTDLPDDLSYLLGATGVDADVEALRAATHAIPDAQSLLVHYSALFLPPTRKALLNVSVYLDGSLNGAAMDGVEALMARYGFAKAEGFHDLPDHLASLLELFALLGDREGTAKDRAMLARAFLLPALPRMESLIAEQGDSPYLHLVRIARRALEPFALPEAPDKRRERAAKRADTELGVWQACRACGRPYAREKELRVMAKALQEQGLPSEHLWVCPDCRNPARPQQHAPQGAP